MVRDYYSLRISIYYYVPFFTHPSPSLPNLVHRLLRLPWRLDTHPLLCLCSKPHCPTLPHNSPGSSIHHNISWFPLSILRTHVYSYLYASPQPCPNVFIYPSAISLLACSFVPTPQLSLSNMVVSP